MRIAFSVMLLAALLVAPAMSLAATDLENFDKRVKKSAPETLDTTPPVVCVCQDAGLAGYAGQLFSYLWGNRLLVFCAILDWNLTTGQFQGFGPSCGTFVLLPK